MSQDLRAQLDRLARQLPRLRQMVEFGSDLILLLDDAGLVVDCNRAATQAIGTARDGLYGERLVDRVEEKACLIEALGQASESGAAPVTLHVRRVDGSRFPVELRLSAFDDGGQRICVAVGRDISERHAMARRTQQVERMVAVGTLAAGVAHEVNNPLAYAQMSLGFALGQLDGADPEVLSALQDVAHGLDRVRRIVGDLSELSRPHDPTQTADLHAAVASALDITDHQVRKRAAVRVDLGRPVTVVGDQARISQVVLNLILNAAHAMDGCADGRIRVSVRVDGEHAVLVVSDNGQGISPDQLDRVFEPFFTTKGVNQGTGLGLAISRETVLSLGGTLELTSRLGEGTTVSMTLPIARPGDAVPEDGVAVSRRQRLLIVDDEPRLAKALGRLLSARHEVSTARSGPEVLGRLQQGERFDALLCDVVMPEMSGPELHAALVDVAPELAARTVFMTGGALSAAARTFVDEQGARCLRKPFAPEEVDAALARLASG